LKICATAFQVDNSTAAVTGIDVPPLSSSRIKMFSRADSSLSATSKLYQFTSVLLFLGLVLLNGCANPRDREAARHAAARIHSQSHNRNFAIIYDEAATGFKTVDRAEFVADMSDLQNKIGAVKNLKEIAYQTGLDSKVGRTHALVFDVQCERERIRETLVFVRGADHKMQLWKLGIEPAN
jgi:hypothetical protein